MEPKTLKFNTSLVFTLCITVLTALSTTDVLATPQVLTVKMNQDYVNRCPWGSGPRKGPYWIDGYLNGKRFGRWDLTTREGCERTFTFNLQSDAKKGTGDTFYKLSLISDWYPNAPMSFNIGFPGNESRHLTFTFWPDGRPELSFVRISPSSTQNPSSKAPTGNLALHKPSFATSTYSSYGSGNANDGDAISIWNGGRPEACWSVDLQGVYVIQTIEVSSNQFGSGGLKTVFQVSSSLNNTEWSAIATPITAMGDQTFTISAGGAQMRYIRYCTLPGSTNWATLGELQAYGTSGQRQ